MEATVDLKEQLRNLYSDYRDALNNKKYYGCRLVQFRQWSMALDLILAIGTSSAVGGWLIWRDSVGQYVWTGLTGVAAVIAVLKPILKLSDQIERYSKLYAGHSTVFYDLDRVIKMVREHKAFNTEMVTIRNNAIDRRKELDPIDDPNPSKSLETKCFQEVNVQISTNMLWFP
ncbi:hypothetical protein [Fibrella forsythiae]|uniref:SMODS and SLOG-associating 2TM effector domain-containing protein n=1 Tax=Fibrella forsythiae TaxID=2817061 RepID=A0ABS3JPN2_9BACT|nr:hypothetical protein [Fibrella forsythiae]MBO0950882.1 hypothetical protein [Fibrella forsythiae]